MEITKVNSNGQNIHLDISEDTIAKILIRGCKYNKSATKSKILVFVIFMLLMASLGLTIGLTIIDHLYPSGFWPSAFIIAGVLIAIPMCYIISVFHKTDIFYLSLFLQDMLDQVSDNYEESFSYSFKSFKHEVGSHDIIRYLYFYKNEYIWGIKCNALGLTKYIDTDFKDILVEITINKRGTKAYVAVYIPDT